MWKIFSGICGKKKTTIVEEFFREWLSANLEAYGEEAGRLGDLVVLSDEEIYPVARMISKRDYKVDRPSLLDPDEKIAVARTLHYKYHASNQQIRRVLKLDLPVVDSLFPTGK